MSAHQRISLTAEDLRGLVTEAAERAADEAALKGALEALRRVGLSDDEASRDIWVLRNLAWFARLWTRRALMCAVGLIFIAVSIVVGGFLRKWLG